MGNPREQRTAALIVFAALALAAYFLAQGTTGLAAAYLLPIRPAPAPTASPRAAARAARRERTSDEQILRRNIFDPSTGDVFELPAVASSEEAAPAPIVPWEHGQPTEACTAPGIRLVGAVVSPNTPEWSFAALAPDGTPKAMLYRAGMSIGSNQLLEVQRDRVVVRPSSGAACHVAMFAQPAAAPAAGAAPPASAEAAVEQATNEAAASESMAEGITQVSESEYTVSRDLVTSLMGNQAELMRMARVIPHEENGQVVGVKLYGIRRSSLLGRLGIRNGDMIRSINGLDVSNPDAALQAFSQLQSASQITMNLQRRGQDTTRTYNIR